MNRRASHHQLSKRFYDRFGEDLTNELVDLLNMIAASYESELRDLNEMNWTGVLLKTLS